MRRLWRARLDVGRARTAIATPWIQAIAVLTAAQVVSELAFSFALPFTPIYIQQLGVPDLVEAGLWAGLMAGVYAVALGVMAPVWGLAADRFGHRLMVQRALLGGEFADHYGLRAGFGVTEVVLFAIGLLVMLVVQEPVREPPGPASTTASSPPERLISRELLAVVGLMAMVRFVNLAPQPVLPLFMEEFVDDPDTLDTTVGLVLSATGIASTVAALSIGRITHRFGWRAVLLGCVGLAVAISPVHLLVASVWQLLVVRSTFGLAIGGMSPAVQALLVRVTSVRSRGAGFGLSTTANALGNGGGPVVGSVSAAEFGEASVFMASIPVLAGAGWLLARLRLPPDASADPAPPESA